MIVQVVVVTRLFVVLILSSIGLDGILEILWIADFKASRVVLGDVAVIGLLQERIQRSILLMACLLRLALL